MNVGEAHGDRTLSAAQELGFSSGSMDLNFLLYSSASKSNISGPPCRLIIHPMGLLGTTRLIGRPMHGLAGQ